MRDYTRRMNKNILLSVSIFSFILFAAQAQAGNFELFAKWDNGNCKITAKSITTEQGFAKGQITLKTTKAVELAGVESVLAKAASTASTLREDAIGYEFDATLNGKHVILNLKDSAESQSLIQLLVRSCKE